MMARWLVEYLARGLARIIRGAWRKSLGFTRFVRRAVRYQRMVSGTDRSLSARYLIPALLDDTSETPVDATYFYQDAWAFERIIAQGPTRHVDVGSHHKFVSLLSRVVPVVMVDIRPLPVSLPNMTFEQGSITALPFEDGSLNSVSSLCVVEHIGLGRYGDPLDPEGTEKAIRELQRVTVPGGHLFLSMPVDVEDRTYYDAHRAFSDEHLEALVSPFEILDRRYIYGREFVDQPRSEFGTVCFHLRKPLG